MLKAELSVRQSVQRGEPKARAEKGLGSHDSCPHTGLWRFGGIFRVSDKI